MEIGMTITRMRPEYVEDNVRLDITVSPLDAPEMIPAGSIREYTPAGTNWRIIGASYSWRGD